MTTAVESLEALHLWLATELPSLRKPDWRKYDYETKERGWVPDVETDGLDGALMELGYHVSRAKVNDEYRTLYSWPDDSSRSRMAYGATAHESACRAARKALEAS